jgi:hypothetical protein
MWCISMCTLELAPSKIVPCRKFSPGRSLQGFPYGRSLLGSPPGHPLQRVNLRFPHVGYPPWRPSYWSPPGVPSRVYPPRGLLKGLYSRAAPSVGPNYEVPKRAPPLVPSRASKPVGQLHGVPPRGVLQVVPSRGSTQGSPPGVPIQCVPSRVSLQAGPVQANLSRRCHRGGNFHGLLSTGSFQAVLSTEFLTGVPPRGPPKETTAFGSSR